MNRGLDRGRGIGIDEGFFVIHVRTSKSTRHFKFRTNSASISPSSFQKANSKHSIDLEEYTHPAQQPTPLKILDLCGSWRFWAHVLNMCCHPTPYPPQPPPSSPHPPPPLPPPGSSGGAWQPGGGGGGAGGVVGAFCFYNKRLKIFGC
jgi:hypothetical protein